MERISLDFIGPLKTTKFGNKMILVITEHFTKFALAIALPNKEAKNVAKVIYERVICFFGTFDVCLTDCGSEFNNQLVDNLLSLSDIKHDKSSPYHPQTNVLTEKFNQTLINTLSTFVNSACDDWDELLAPVLFAYNSKIHISTKISPFKAMFLRNPQFTLAWENGIKNFNNNPDENSVKKISEKIIENNLQAQKEQNKYYDSKNKVIKFEVGDKVFRINSKKNQKRGL